MRVYSSLASTATCLLNQIYCIVLSCVFVLLFACALLGVYQSCFVLAIRLLRYHVNTQTLD